MKTENEENVVNNHAPIEQLIKRKTKASEWPINMKEAMNNFETKRREREKIVSRQAAMDELLKLRDHIFIEMAKENKEFEHYHNIMQQPFHSAILNARCSDLTTFLKLEKIQLQMSRQPAYFMEKQIQIFGNEIGILLARIDYSVPDISMPI